VAFYQMLLRPEEPVPAPTRTVPEVLGTPGWADAIAVGLALYR
jgi:hypothetical protein